MRSELFAASNMEQESAQPGLRLQNSKLLKVELRGEVFARVGSMVAYQGNVQFQAQGSGGLSKFLKQKLTGEGVPLMKAVGHGDVFLADNASDIYLIDLEGPHDGLTINGANVLAFERGATIFRVHDVEPSRDALAVAAATLAADGR